MAFVRVEEWGGELGQRFAIAAAAPMSPAANRTGAFSRPNAILLSTAIHGLLMWLIVSGLSGAEPGQGTAPGSGAPLVVDLAPAGAGGKPEQAAIRPPPSPAATQPTEMDVGTAALGIPQEWTLTRIAAAPAAAAALDSVAQAAPGPAGAAAGGGSHDPFAGAAPLRDPRSGTLTNNGWDLNQQAFRMLVARVFRAAGGAVGTVEWRARLSPDGVVVAVEITGGSAPLPLRRALQNALTGQDLFRSRSGTRAPAVVALPTIDGSYGSRASLR